MIKYFLANPDEISSKTIRKIINEYDPEAKIVSALGHRELLDAIFAENPGFILLSGDLSESGYNLIDISKEIRTKFLSNPHIVAAATAMQLADFQEELTGSEINALFPIPLNETAFRIHLKNWLNEVRSASITDFAVADGDKALMDGKYAPLFEKISDGILILDNQGQITAANNSVGEISGIKPGECVGMPLQAFLHKLKPATEQTGLTRESLVELLKQVLTNNLSPLFGKVNTGQICRTDGKIRHVEITVYPLHGGDDNSFFGCVVRDITNQKLLGGSTQPGELKYQNIFDENNDAILIFFLNQDKTVSNFIEANQAACELTGYPKNELLSMNLFDFDIPGETLLFPYALNGLQQKGHFNSEATLRKKNGEQTNIDFTIQPIKYDGQTATMIIARDVARQKNVRLFSADSEARFKMLFEKAPIGYQALDEKGTLTEVNETWLQMMGYTKEEVIGRWFGSFVTPDFLGVFVEQCNQVKKEQLVHCELELYKKNGKTVRIQIRGFAGQFPNEDTSLLHCILTDITELHSASKAIAEERILLRTLIDNIPDMIFVKDILGRKLISNKADLALLGWTDENDVIGKTDLEIFGSDIAGQMYQDDLTVISTGEPIVNKHQTIVDRNGVKRTISSTKIPLTGGSGEIIGLVGVTRDITREIQIEQKITQLSKGIEQSPSSIIITDISGNIEYANTKVEEKTGYRLDEIIGKNPRIFQSGYTSVEEYRKLWETIKNGQEYHGEIQNRKKDGEIYWESVLISPLRNEEGKIVNYIAIKEDITNRKKYELELTKLNIAIEQSPASVIITNTEGVIEYVNKKFISTTGYQVEELTGKIVRILKPGHLSDEAYIELWNCLYSGKEWRGEHLNRTKNNIKYWESVLISPVTNQEGKITNYIILSEDISERKKMENDLIQAKEKAVESDRLKSAFLANMSHEIRTPLNSILGFSDLLADPKLDNETRLEYAGLINISGTNLLAIINDVLDISKIEAGQIVLTESLFSAIDLVREIKKEYSYKAQAKGIELRLSLPENVDEIPMKSDIVRVKQVLINFVGNAIKFTDSGYVEIGLSQAGNEVRFQVKDTGIGIPNEYHQKIFERFRQVEGAQTRRYGGNGLGLAITKNLAELLGGRVWVESEPGRGSTFYFAVRPEE